MVAVTVAGLLGIVLAALIGWLVARRAVRPLGAALTLQRRFVADASHELRTPLAVVHTRAQLLRMQTRPDHPNRPELDQLIDDTRVLGDVVTDLLTSAQLEHTAPVGEEVDAGDLAQLVARSIDRPCRRTGYPGRRDHPSDRLRVIETRADTSSSGPGPPYAGR